MITQNILFLLGLIYIEVTCIFGFRPNRQHSREPGLAGESVCGAKPEEGTDEGATSPPTGHVDAARGPRPYPRQQGRGVPGLQSLPSVGAR